MEIHFYAEQIFTVGSVTITNTLITSLFSSVLLIAFSLFVSRRLKLTPDILQNVVEFIIETLNNVNVVISGKGARLIFPWFATFFLFILVSNWTGLLPGFGSLGFFEHRDGKEIFTPLFRPANTDLNMTLGLALISLFATHIMSIGVLGVREYIGRFISLNPVNLFVGILEIVSEITKVASLSLRLFGNIFAGEAILITTSSFFAFIAPLPFMVLETVVGFVQALIFAMLTMVFMTILSTPAIHIKEEVKG